MKTVNIPVQNNADAAIIIEFLDEFFWPNIAKGCQKFLKTSMTKVFTQIKRTMNFFQKIFLL